MGHIKRCLAIASALKKEKDLDIQFVIRNHGMILDHLISERGFKVRQLDNLSNKTCLFNINKSKRETNFYNEKVISQKQDAIDTIKAVNSEKFDWIITDSKFLNDVWKSYMKFYTNNFFEIDDIFRETSISDVVLNQAPSKFSFEKYKDKITPKTKLLLGHKYAILDETYLSLKHYRKKHTGKISKILISYGGSDDYNETIKALYAINNLGYTHLEINVVIGETNRNLDMIVKEANKMKNTNCHVELPTLAHLMKDSDLALGSGGGTTWERIYLGVPSLVTTSSEDQVSVPYLNDQGYLFWLGNAKDVDQKHIGKKIIELMQNPKKLIDQSLRCKKFIDGKGVIRIINTLKAKKYYNI